MAIDFTPEQRKAIEAKGNILVAAAAGSGKTAVLTERVVENLCSKENPISADRLLIVTYTESAANEMRTRIEKRLNEKLAESNNNPAIVLQKRLLAEAKICTIDSFCIDLVRENFELAGVSPDFKISDGTELDEINRKTASDIVNRYLAEDNAEFLKLLDIVGTEFDENSFIDFILRIYDYSRQLPFPKIWFNSLSENYKSFDKDNPWRKYCFVTAEKMLKSLKSAFFGLDNLFGANLLAAERFEPFLKGNSERVESLICAACENNWDKFYIALSDFEFMPVPSVAKISDLSEVSAAKAVFRQAKNVLDEIKKLFFCDSDYITEQFAMLYPSVKLLSEILTEFDETVFSIYKENNIFTFHNTEHLALGLLCEWKDGEIALKPYAKEIIDRFDEIMVDEYQDVNDLQDILFDTISDNGKKLFVVGDVKQSIYSFRGANPKNFLKKKNTRKAAEKAEENEPKKIILGNNFRSSEGICGFVNSFFGVFMNESTGDIVYDGEEILIPSLEFPQTNESAVELHIVENNKEKLSDFEAQSAHIADYILSKVDNEEFIFDKETKTLRKAQFSDFAVLLRKSKGTANEMASVLKNKGIPVSISSTDFFTSTEVSTVLSVLKIIDNPMSDIELLCSMMSPIFAFSPEEIAQIRADCKSGTLYSAVMKAGNNGNEKVNSFLKKLENLRLLSVTEPFAKLVSDLIYDSGYKNIVSGMESGAKRVNNLRILADMAKKYSEDFVPSVSGFLRYAQKQSERLEKVPSSANENAVKIMTIHSSKGLQFPVVIVAETEKIFNDEDSKKPNLFSTELGIGFRYFSETEKTKSDTVSRNTILHKSRCERHEEELRLLYVAMTRAEDKLVFVSNAGNTESTVKDLKNLLYYGGGFLDFPMFHSLKSYYKWLVTVALLDRNSAFGKDYEFPYYNENNSNLEVKIIDSFEISPETDVKPERNSECSADTFEKISEALAYKYPFDELLSVESKTSVTALSHDTAESTDYSFSQKPSFTFEDGLNYAEKGTATHKVLQFIDFEATDIDSEIERLKEWQYISEKEASAVNTDSIRSFFSSEIFKRIKKSDLVKREMRFLSEIPANQVYKDLKTEFPDEKIIVQGAVDLCFCEDGKIVILDFKTDRVKDLSVLANTYREQLNLYEKACERIFKMPVKEKIIYSLYNGAEIKV